MEELVKSRCERPYSYLKIAFAIFLGLLALIVFFVMLERSEVLQQTQYYN